jgi:hypothetical protein
VAAGGSEESECGNQSCFIKDCRAVSHCYVL